MSRFNRANDLDLYGQQDIIDPIGAWDEYCGFLALPLENYLHVQNRLMEEQMSLWCPSGIGRHILKGKAPMDICQFREQVPLTDYADYADILLARREDLLPAPVVTWVETTWEGGERPIKLAPYTQGILDAFKRNGKSNIMLASANGWADYRIGTNVLSGLAPLPYLTGLMGIILDEEFHFRFMPPHSTTKTMGFSARTKLGFKMALGSGIDYFLGMGSISYYMSKQLSQSVSGAGLLSKAASGGRTEHTAPSLGMISRVLKARKRAEAEGREVLPKDLFDLRGFVVAGTDNACYKDDLERQWGIRPMELFAGTECGLVGTETWNRSSLYFFPDACFYEFLPVEYVRCRERYLPTVTIDQVQPGESYELVITSLRGGAFARYRTGDMYRCVGIGDVADHSKLPRFHYVDRVPTVIDIAGFTRITENSINDVINLSRLPVKGWCAAKEFERESGHPFLHMYIELEGRELENTIASEDIIRRHLELYFSYFDGDYESLRTILEMDPLKITFLQNGSFEAYERAAGKPFVSVNPSQRDVHTLVDAAKSEPLIHPWERAIES